jgi:hypothetical protein
MFLLHVTVVASGLAPYSVDKWKFYAALHEYRESK